MPSIWVPEAYAAFAGNGGADGYVTVADNSKFYPGAEVFIVSDTVTGSRGKITDLVSTNKIGVRLLKEFPLQPPSYGRSDLSAYLLADNAKIDMPAQVVPVNQPSFSKFPLL